MSISGINQSTFLEEELKIMDESVFYHPTLTNTIVFKQLKNPRIETYEYMLEKLTALSEKLPFHYAIADNSALEGKFSKEMRHFGKQYMAEKRNPLHIASVTETNVLMKMMVKFMAGVKPSFSYSLHTTFEQAEEKIASILKKNELEDKTK